VSNFQCIKYEQRNGAAWVTLNRPDALNAISLEVMEELDQALDAAEADPEVRVFVITGEGRAFCAGADLKRVRDATVGRESGGMDTFLAKFMAVTVRLEEFPMPVIAAVNGLALAGGLELVLCCDLVVAAESAKLGDAHANYGLVPGAGNSVRLPRKIGQTRASYLMFTAEFVPAAELVEAGLVNFVVPDNELMSAVADLVSKMSNKSPLGLARMKRLILDGMEMPRHEALRAEILTNNLHAKSEDMQEGLAAFKEKRAPVYTGR
jgi:enoyl-CoA hydratase/carnithine racemase